MNLLNRIANYFANEYQNDDKTAPEFRVSVDDLRDIANLNVEKSRLETELREARETIRKLLCSEYGSSCSFCIHDDDPEAMCCNVGGSGSWCCKNASWKGSSRE